MDKPLPSPSCHRNGHAALRKGRASLPHVTYLVTATTNHRHPFFHRFDVGCAASSSFQASDLLGDAKLLAWVLMPDHAHWLVTLGETEGLDVLIGRMKAVSARRANRALRRQGTLWAPAFHDRALRRDDDLQAAARYIIANPLRAGLVARVGDYPFWNAVWL